MEEEKPELTKAQEVLQKDRLEREQKCLAEIQETLKKYNCAIVAAQAQALPPSCFTVQVTAK